MLDIIDPQVRVLRDVAQAIPARRLTGFVQRIEEKHFLAAVTLLVSSSKTISKPEMASVGALSDLSRFFNEQLEVRTDGFCSRSGRNETVLFGKHLMPTILTVSYLVHGRDPNGRTS